jgi:hypothetical protein
MFRIIREPDDYATAASPEDIAQTIRHARPGRFVVEEVSPAGQLLPSGHSCRRWGTAIRHKDGHVTLDPDPWPA